MYSTVCGTFQDTFGLFGGVGASGSGSYHGIHGFRAFSHERAVLRQGRVDLLKTVYPPYGPKVSRMIKWMSKLFT